MLSRIVTQNGSKVFEIDGKTFIPAAFRSFRPTPANVSLFYRNGVRLFQMQCTGLNNTWKLPYSNYGPVWVGDHTYDFSALDRQMEMFMKFAPEGYFMLMVQLDMPEWWRLENNCQCNSYRQLGDAALNQKWVQDACDYLRAFIRYAEETYGDRVFAYSFSAGCATEWFDYGGLRVSDAKAAYYRSKCGDPEAVLPSEADLLSTGFPALRSDDSVAYQYQKCCSELTPSLILQFAGAAQEVLAHQKIVGIFFGYSGLPPRWQNRMGTNGYEKVWESDDIDMLFAPAAYSCRKIGDAASYQYTVDSVGVNGKLYLHEVDHHTYLSKYPTETFKMMSCIYEDEETTINVLRRELCAAAVKSGALWWFDMQGGWYASPGLEKEISHEMEILSELYKLPHQSVAEIAVFVDPMSYLRMPDEGNLTVDCGRNTRNNLHHCGAPFDYFNLADITRIDLSRYKMCVFLNAIDLSDKVKAALASLHNATKVWLWAPNWASGGSEEVCSIHLKEIDEAQCKVRYGGELFGFTDPVAPLWAVDDSEAEILAYYENGLPACARKGKDVYIPVGNVPTELWRDLARDAGVHIYSETPGAFYADSRFVARQSALESDLTIRMPFDCVLEELFDGGIYKTQDKELKYSAKPGSTKLFVIREKINEIKG